jgi:ornithine cyclodeaminase
VASIAAMADVETGYPLMISEMTILTAIRTAATSALSSKYLAKQNATTVGIIGCGAQSEFQIIAHKSIIDSITEVKCYDIDVDASKRLQENLKTQGINVIIASSAAEAVCNVDIAITVTAAPGKNKILTEEMVAAGTHICGIGGDSVGKTEIDPDFVKKCKVVIEFFEQTSHEGEIQNLGEEAKDFVYAEMHEIISGAKKGRVNDEEITLFDSVGFAMEDFSILNYTYRLAQQYNEYRTLNMVPDNLSDCKNLYGTI